jgi:hypothetical protein
VLNSAFFKSHVDSKYCDAKTFKDESNLNNVVPR